MIVIGLMSGTSVDGVDAAVVRLQDTPPTLVWEILAHTHMAYPPTLRHEIMACFDTNAGRTDRLCHLGFALGRLFGTAALEAIAAAGLKPAQAHLIGSHGQTLWHDPLTNPFPYLDQGAGATLQLGEPAIIAEMTGLPVVSNFRPRDMAVGGQVLPSSPMWMRCCLPTLTEPG